MGFFIHHSSVVTGPCREVAVSGTSNEVIKWKNTKDSGTKVQCFTILDYRLNQFYNNSLSIDENLILVVHLGRKTPKKNKN